MERWLRILFSHYGSERESVATVFFLKQDYFPYFTHNNIKFNIQFFDDYFYAKNLNKQTINITFFLLDFSEWGSTYQNYLDQEWMGKKIFDTAQIGLTG